MSFRLDHDEEKIDSFLDVFYDKHYPKNKDFNKKAAAIFEYSIHFPTRLLIVYTNELDSFLDYLKTEEKQITSKNIGDLEKEILSLTEDKYNILRIIKSKKVDAKLVSYMFSFTEKENENLNYLLDTYENVVKYLDTRTVADLDKTITRINNIHKMKLVTYTHMYSNILNSHLRSQYSEPLKNTPTQKSKYAQNNPD